MAPAMVQRLLHIVGLAALIWPTDAHFSPCSCGAEVNTDPSLYYCKASGDPHFTTFNDDHFDFMGRGLYELVRFTTECGCDVMVQVLQAQLTKVCVAHD